MNQDWSYICGDFWEKGDPFVDYFCAQAKVECYPKGYRLIRQGEPGRHVYLPLNGSLKNSMVFENGNAACNLLFVGSCLLGISSIDGPSASQVEVRCLSECRIAAIPSRRIAEWPATKLLSIALCQTWKMEIMYRQLRERSLYTAEEQLLKLLRDAEEAGMLEGSPNAILRQALVAEMLNLSRTQLSAILSKLERQDRLSPAQRQYLSLIR